MLTGAGAHFSGEKDVSIISCPCFSQIGFASALQINTEQPISAGSQGPVKIRGKASWDLLRCLSVISAS